MLIEGSLYPPKNQAEWIDLRIRAFGTCAFLMLSLILCIGPLARLNPRFLPLLYNRRHFGVLMFLVASVHAWSMVEWFIVLGVLRVRRRADRLAELFSSSASRSRRSAWSRSSSC
jgi:hypothetical protein